jgi:hypothetical protein
LITGSAAAIFLSNKSLVNKHRLTVFFMIIGILSVFLSSQVSTFLWNYLPSSFIQFPFRLLSLSLISLAFIGAFVVSHLKSWQRHVFIFAIALSLSVSSVQYIKSVEYINKGEGFYTTNSSTTTVHDEYMPTWVKEKPTQRPDKKVEILDGEGEISDLNNSNKKVAFTANLETDSIIRLNTIYWPGWRAYINNKEVEINYENQKGLMEIGVPAGIWQVKFNFFEIPVRLISDIISVISFCVLIYIAFKKHRATSRS